MTMTCWLADPWTVYGDVRSPDCADTDGLRVAIADVGILPPAGRYIGEIAVDGGVPVLAGCTVPPPPDVWVAERCITVDLRNRPDAAAGSQVTLRFRGIEI